MKQNNKLKKIYLEKNNNNISIKIREQNKMLLSGP